MENNNGIFKICVIPSIRDRFGEFADFLTDDDIATEITQHTQNCENQEESLKNVQICYKTNEPCKHGCDGLCKESC